MKLPGSSWKLSQCDNGCPWSCRAAAECEVSVATAENKAAGQQLKVKSMWADKEVGGTTAEDAAVGQQLEIKLGETTADDKAAEQQMNVK